MLSLKSSNGFPIAHQAERLHSERCCAAIILARKMRYIASGIVPDMSGVLRLEFLPAADAGAPIHRSYSTAAFFITKGIGSASANRAAARIWSASRICKAS